jgi:hypothetical protein
LDYQALLGNSFDGNGGSGTQGEENIRFSACRLCVIENNVSENANTVGAVFKLQDSNSCSVGPTNFCGVYEEYIEISDNLFTGHSGGQSVEISPENGAYDERLRNIVIERNLFAPPSGINDALIISAQNVSLRDNVFYVAAGQSHPVGYIAQIGSRGNIPAWPTQYIEAYNNTCYVLSTSASQSCINFSGRVPLSVAAVNSWAKNNLFYDTYGGSATVLDSGSGNTVSSNTATPTNNPDVTNGSGSFSLISDFRPTANYSGGTNVPVWYDALDALWATWDLGAVHP